MTCGSFFYDIYDYTSKDIDNYTSKIEGKPAYISVRPYKIVKKNKKSYGKWSEKIVLTK